MSAIADFRMIQTDKLDGLKESAEIIVKKGFFKKTVTDNYWAFLENNSSKLKDFEGSGYLFTNLLLFLQENKGIDLLTCEFDDIANWISEKRRVSVIILTFNHKKSYLDKLNPENFNESELIAFNKDFSDDESPESAKAEIAGIKYLRESLLELKNDKEVIILNIG